MSRFGLAILLSTYPIAASAAPKGHSAEILCQRVQDELLREGTSLAKLGRALTLEPDAPGRWRLAVKDTATGKVVSQKENLDLPVDLDAAVAQLVIAVRPMLPVAEPSDPWRTTFSSEALSSHLRGKDLKIVVVPAGDRLDEARAAAAAIEAALRTAPRCKLVLDGGGAVGGATLADPAILEKAARLPMDQAFVVRAFVDAESVSAVVTMYDHAKEVVGALTAVRGQPLARGVTADERGAGLAEAVTLVGEKSRDRKKADERAGPAPRERRRPRDRQLRRDRREPLPAGARGGPRRLRARRAERGA